MTYTFQTLYNSHEHGEIEVEVECWIEPPQRETWDRWGGDPELPLRATVEHVRHNGREVKIDYVTAERLEMLAIELIEGGF